MSDQLKIENIDRVFRIFDRDGDGRLSKEDFSSAGRGVAREFGFDAESPEARRVIEGHEEVWNYICGADLDVDGEVGPEEFREAHMSGRVTTEVIVEKWQIAARANFEAADSDNDGYIDLDGLTRIYRGTGIDSQVAEAAFRAMDVDDDGRLDWPELAANVRGLFTATDESAKGANMVSALDSPA